MALGKSEDRSGVRTGVDAVDVPVPPIVVQLRQRPGPDMAGQPVLYCPRQHWHASLSQP